MSIAARCKSYEKRSNKFSLKFLKTISKSYSRFSVPVGNYLKRTAAGIFPLRQIPFSGILEE